MLNRRKLHRYLAYRSLSLWVEQVVLRCDEDRRSNKLTRLQFLTLFVQLINEVLWGSEA